MFWLKKKSEQKDIVALEAQTKYEIEVRQTEALTTLAEGVRSIATFLHGGGLSSILSGYARSQAVKDILGGLAAHDGRDALDARVLGQNALEIVSQVEKVFEQYEQKLNDKSKRDPEIHNSENDFQRWVKDREKD